MKFILAALALLLATSAYADEVYKPVGSFSVSISTGASSVSSSVTPGAVCAQCRKVQLVASVDAWVDFTTDAVSPAGSTSTSLFLPASTATIYDIRPGATIAVVAHAATTGGVLHVTVLSD